MDAKTAALDILFADDLDDLESSGSDREDYAKTLNVTLFMNNHWSELRSAAKTWLHNNLVFKSNHMVGLPGLPK